MLSIASKGSFLSIGSYGSALSLGSIGSVASAFSVGSAASLGSALLGRLHRLGDVGRPAQAILGEQADDAALRAPRSHADR